MSNCRVWAPRAHTVSVIAAGAESSLQPGDGGWWVGPPLPSAADSVDYGFRIDGGPPRPDPRSRWQPAGVHELSRTFDPGRYRWSDGDWTGKQLAGAVIYELHIGTFTAQGTLDGAIEKLDYLVDLGIDCVELLPVNAFNGPWNWGYDGVLWFAVAESYGGPAAYQRFVDACHLRGLAVVQDVVYNHLGPSGNYLPEFGPYLREDSSNTWGASVNLDGPGSDEVRRYILDNAAMWFTDYHVDGLRLDAVHALADSRATHILEEMATSIAALEPHLRRPLSLIAESDLANPTLYTPRAAGGYGLTASWNDDFHHALHVALTRETSGYYSDFDSIAALAKVFTDGYFHNGTYSSFRQRDHGRPIAKETTPTWRLVTFAQNHDQIGNRAAGDRLTAALTADQLALAAVVSLTAPFTPMLFMGEEWAATTPWQFFTSHPEPELADVTRHGRIEEFARHGWDTAVVADPQDPATFERSTLSWPETALPKHRQMRALYRALIHLRRWRPELTDPRWDRHRVEFSESERWLLIDHGTVVVTASFSDQPSHITFPIRDAAIGDGDTRWQLLLHSWGEEPVVDGHDVMQPAWSATIWSCDEGESVSDAERHTQ